MSRTSPSPHALLEVIEGPHAGQRLDYDCYDTLLVGRGSSAGLRLVHDPHFSRNHFLLEINPPDVLLRDLGSRNGTFVNGKKVQQCRLQPGDIISGGLTRIRFALRSVQDEIVTVDLPDRPADALIQSVDAPVPPSESPTLCPQTASFAAQDASSLPADMRPNTTHLVNVPGYDIVRKLGQGGMSVVYLARKQTTQELVALKIIVPESSANDRALNLFFREARILSQLDHPNIVRYDDMGIHLGQVFLVMEYVETIERKSLLTDRPLAERIQIASDVLCQVLDGLHYAHELGIVHRDFKPGNILISWRDASQPVQAKLADFGLAKNYQQAGLSGMTHEGEALGTIPFMAPEQVVSARDARPAVDIYAAGATLYYLISGSYTHDFVHGREPLVMILEEPAVPLRQRCPDVPAGLADVIGEALAKDPRDRFQTAEALRRALSPYASGPV